MIERSAGSGRPVGVLGRVMAVGAALAVGATEVRAAGETAAASAPPEARGVPEDDAKLLAADYRATGVIECGGMRSTGQLTFRADRVTSAAHAFYDEDGRPRAEQGRCVFLITIGGVRRGYTILPDAERCGSTRPFGVPGRHDWAVARLAEPVAGVRPYRRLGPVQRGQSVVMVSDHPAQGRRVELCRIRDVVEGGDGAPREFRTDCDGVPGMSGAAYLSVGPNPGLVGIHVGIRRAAPGTAAAYSERHHSFGTSAERAFAAAIHR